MIKVTMTMDIHDYEPKVLGVLTLKQSGYVMAAGTLGYLSYRYLPFTQDMKIVVLFVLFVLTIFLGWGKIRHMPPLKYMAIFMRNKILTGGTRNYTDSGIFIKSQTGKSRGRIRRHKEYRGIK